MKRLVMSLLAIYLLVMFLVYTGFFRDNSDPKDVVKYYYDCLKNWESFLTYQVYLRENFDGVKIFSEMKERRLFLLQDVSMEVIRISDANAYVQAKLCYRNKQSLASMVELTKVGKKWLIKDVRYD